MLFKRFKKKKPLSEENGINTTNEGTPNGEQAGGFKLRDDEILQIDLSDGHPKLYAVHKVYLGKSKRFWTYE